MNVQLGSKLALANNDETAKEEEPKTETKIVEYKIKKEIILVALQKIQCRY